MSAIEVFTIGFTQKSAEEFFTLLRDAGVKRILDVRLSNNSQLAGFAKRDDLRYFLKSLCDIEYEQVELFAPTKAILDAYRKHNGDWDVYEAEFLELMSQRSIESQFEREFFERSCLLCSEHLPQQCHRRLVVDYLNRHWNCLTMTHLTDSCR